MNEQPHDDLWPHFAPLWTDLRAITPGLLLAGGYGLFLKQQWLLSQMEARTPTEQGGIATLVDMARWMNPTPRVTKDLDFVVQLDMIERHGQAGDE